MTANFRKMEPTLFNAQCDYCCLLARTWINHELNVRSTVVLTESKLQVFYCMNRRMEEKDNNNRKLDVA